MILRRNKLLIFVLSLFLSLASSQYCFSQDGESEYIIQKDFILLIFHAKQFNNISETNRVSNPASVDDFTTTRTYSDSIDVTSILGKKRYLEHLGYCPEGGYSLDKILTYGDFAVTLVKLLKLPIPDDPTPEDYIKILVEKGIIDQNDPETPMTEEEVIAAMERANIPVVEIKMPDYQKPLSPIE